MPNSIVPALSKQTYANSSPECEKAGNNSLEHSAAWDICLLARVSVKRRLMLKSSADGSTSTNAIDLPFGDQPGALLPTGLRIDRSFRSGPPSAGTMYIPVFGPAMRWKAICVPSGDQAGLIHSDGSCVNRSKFSLPMTL